MTEADVLRYFQNKISGWMQEILKGVENEWIRPHVDRTFRFEQAGGILKREKTPVKLSWLPAVDAR